MHKNLDHLLGDTLHHKLALVIVLNGRVSLFSSRDSNKYSTNVVVYFVAIVNQSTTACSSFNQVFNCPTNQECAINSVNGVPYCA